MRSTTRTRWATCALALSIANPALADSPRKSVADCALFTQVEKDEATLQLQIHNSCSMPVDCKISWRVTCAPEAKKRRAVHERAASFTLSTGAERTTDASAAECGDDAFSLDQVEWSCEPNNH